MTWNIDVPGQIFCKMIKENVFFEIISEILEKRWIYMQYYV